MTAAILTDLWVSWYCRHCGAKLEPIGAALHHLLTRHRNDGCCAELTRELLDEVITERGRKEASE